MSGLDPHLRRQVEQFVRPLYAGLDGVQTFDRVDRLRARVEAIRGEAVVEEDLLDLLLLLQGVTDRLGSLAPGGRLDLFLKGLGLSEALVRRVRAGLGRLPDEPRGTEEELIHDALLLEASGVVAAAERLMAAGKKRTPVGRALAQLDPGPAAERYRTARGAELGARRRREAEEWIADLRRRVAEEIS
ncbi:MAG TPA: hypothetical protein VH394_12070 [Thermoanaerobaculia bacterium]|jgi:hypothetical protein|nr:hypothetical protein [Thermoanaerobaculia bacterium]